MLRPLASTHRLVGHASIARERLFNARAAISVLLCTRLRKPMEPTEQRTRMPTSSHNPQTPSHAACRPPAHVACIQKRQQAGHNHIQHARGPATPGTRPRGGVNEEGLAVSPARARARPRAGQPCRGSQAGGMACGWWVAGRAHLRRRSVQHRPKAGSSASGSPGRYLPDELLSGLSAQHRGTTFKPSMLCLECSFSTPRLALKAGKLFLPKRVSGGGEELIQ